MEWAARQFYSLSSIVERMARSRTGLWCNIARNVGYHLALRNFGRIGFNPEDARQAAPIQRNESEIRVIEENQSLTSSLTGIGSPKWTRC
jgi:hypothetical protein